MVNNLSDKRFGVGDQDGQDRGEKRMRKFEVLEDNGGGVHLVVFGENSSVDYLHSNYEFMPGQLKEDINKIMNGEFSLNSWEGNSENPQRVYEDMMSLEHGCEVIADNDGIYREKMGVAGKLELDQKKESKTDIKTRNTQNNQKRRHQRSMCR